MGKCCVCGLELPEELRKIHCHCALFKVNELDWCKWKEYVDELEELIEGEK